MDENRGQDDISKNTAILYLKSSKMFSSGVLLRLLNWISNCIMYFTTFLNNSNSAPTPWSFIATTQWMYVPELKHEEEFLIGYEMHA